MATRTWSGATNNNWSNAGNWDTAPSAGDDVIMANNVNCVIDANTVALNSLDQTSYTGVMSGSSDITVTVASGTSVCKFQNGANHTWTGVLKLNPAAGTTISLTFNGMTTCGGITEAGTTTGRVDMLDAITIGATKTVTLTSGTLHTDGASDVSGLTHSWGKFTTGASTKTITCGNSTIHLTANNGGGDIVWNSSGANTTFNSNTSTIIVDGSGLSYHAVYPGSSQTFNNLTFALTSTGDCSIENVATTITNLTITQPANKTSYFKTNTTITVNGALTLTGQSSVNRLLVRSITLGTTATITLGASATCKTNSSNVDFRDITMSGGPDTPTAGYERNLSAITGGSGDCGGNTGITFTTADDWYWHNPDGTTPKNFSDYSMWYDTTRGGGSQMASTRVVLPQDNAYFDGYSMEHGSITVDQDMPRMCKTLDFTGVGAMNFHMDNISQTLYGGFITTANVTLTTGNALTFESMDRSGSYTFTCANYNGNINMYPIGGTITLGGNLSQAAGYAFVHSYGTFNGGGYTVNLANYQGTDITRTLIFGNGLWTLGSITTQPFTPAGVSNLNFTKGNSDIVVVARTNGDYTFAGGGLTFNNITVNTGGSNSFILTGSNTFSTFTINAPKTVKFTAGTNTTVATFTATGTGANHIVIASVTAGSNFQLTKAGGGTSVNDYLDVTDSHGHPDATFYYGANGSGDAYSQANGWAATAGGATGYMTTMRGYW